MDTMRAVRVGRFGGPEALTIENVPKPRPGPGEALVRVEAAGVNPIDWKLREGLNKDLPLPFTPGFDFCGMIESLGAGASGFKKGDIVFGCAAGSGGAEAEYLAVSTKNMALKPRTLEPVEAAGVPLAGMTAWQGLFTHGRLKSGETVLILGASGGVGMIAVQLAKLVGAGRVIGTGSSESIARLRSLGCDVPVDYRKQRFEDSARGVDLCLDLLGGEFQQRAFSTVKRGGRLISTVSAPDPALSRRHGITAEVFYMKPDAAELFELALKIDAGQLKVSVEKVMPLDKAAEAEELNRRHEVHGKIVLRVG